MSRRSLLAGALASAQAPTTLNAASGKPNAIVILFDDLGVHDFGCLGASDVLTPHIDRLAADGTTCRNWYSNAPVCAPARAALMTLDAVALIRTALDARQFGWIRGSAALDQLEGSARLLLATLAEASHVPADGGQRHGAAERSERRFTSALPRLRHAGIDVTDDVQAGQAEYVRLRASWDAPLVSLGGLLGYTPKQIDVSI